MISFAEFLQLAHGADVTPYPWQARLAERCAQREPPPVIAVPTGAGKTTTIDALVWALAQQADRPAAERTVGVRIVWAIDRRILVDEVHKHAARLAGILDEACRNEGAPLHDMARRLAMISDAAPLVATRWRGGLESRPEGWGPLQPQIITSTIAQIGSRLLFRGYGVGRKSLALEGGLAACDTTICLDEAHLAEPFRETVEAICNHREACERGLALPGLRTITLTATPSREAVEALTLDEGDRLALGSRFTGPKRAVLVEPEPGEMSEGAQVKRLAEAATNYVHEGSLTVACVVNTVRRARAVFDMLCKELGDEAEIALLIGPQRPADRNRMLNRHWGALFEGATGERPLVCVATQTFEVGLDADVATMVTESASATALVQRLGRLNRRGATSGRATIVRDAGCWLYAEDEPVAWEWLQGLMGDDDAIDVSVAALAEHPPPQPSRTPYAATLTSEIVELFAQTAPSPHAWCEPDADAFLRGPEAKRAAEVALCWRSDLRADRVGKEFDQYRSMLLKLVPPQPQELLTLSLTAARALLAARYPERRDQAASAAKAALLEADVEYSMREMSLPDPRRSHGMVPFVIVRGQEVHSGTLRSAKAGGGAEEDEASAISLSAIRPGDIVVLPASAGGADDNGLAPLQPREQPTSDVATDRQPYGDPVPVRITPEALAGVGETQIESKRWQRVAATCRKTEEAMVNMNGQKTRAEHVDRLIKQLRAPDLLAENEGLGLLAPGSPERNGWTVMLRSITAADADGAPHLAETDFGADEVDDLHEAEEPEAGIDEAPLADSSTTEVGSPERVWVLLPIKTKDAEIDERHLGDEREPPTIDQHARAVGGEVRKCAERLRLEPALTTALVLAARAHDHGKADARTQAFYRRGVHALAATPIAKSEFGTHDPRTAAIATALAGMPKHQRHEIASVAVLDDALASGALEMELDGMDRDLALHVVGVHHGLGRPIPEVPEGGHPSRSFKIDAAGVAGRASGDGRDGWANGAWLERFWQVFERYGPWGAAYLEALLVLSDRVVSAEGR